MSNGGLQKFGPKVLVAGLAVLTLLAVWFAERTVDTPLGFPLDDAWIHMVYGRSLAQDGGLAYNPGEPTTGATSLLWAVLLGAVHVVVGHAHVGTRIVAVLLLGGVLHVLTALLAENLTQRLATPRVGLAAGVLVALNPAMAGAALSGMEVALTAALLLAGVRALVLRSWLMAGAWLALLPLARPEGALVAVALVAWSTWLDRPIGATNWLKRALHLGGPALALGLLVIARNLETTHHPLPATYYAKLAHIPWTETPQRLWRAVHQVLGETPPLWHGAGLIFLAGLGARTQRLALLPVLAAFAFLLGHVRVSELGDPRVFYGLRYLLPIVPVLTVALVLGAVGIGQWLPPRVQVVPLLLLLMTSLTQGALTLLPVSEKLASDTRNIDEVQCAAGRWIHEHVPVDRRVATVDAGAVRYLGDRWTLDLLGLNTPMMLWHPDLYARAYPIAAVVFMPELGRPEASPELAVPWQARAKNYRVTLNPALALQAIVTCPHAPDSQARPLALQGPGLHTLVWCQKFDAPAPGVLHESP